ncbi:hypothetical protein AMV268 [Betaentomopoxvirus amoorei]|nr:hypothetical protein AMV268 [Amsacta moorei entomopoxvirus]
MELPLEILEIIFNYLDNDTKLQFIDSKCIIPKLIYIRANK